MMDFEAAFKEGAGVVSGCGVALEIDEVAVAIFGFGVVDVVLRDFVQSGGGSERGDVTAEAVVFAIGGDDHGHGVPANVTADAAFHASVAGVFGLVLRRDGVRVRSADGGGDVDAGLAELLHQVFKEQLGLLGVLRFEDVLEDVFEGFEILARVGPGAVAGAAGSSILAGHFGGYATFSGRKIHLFEIRSPILP